MLPGDGRKSNRVFSGAKMKLVIAMVFVVEGLMMVVKEMVLIEVEVVVVVMGNVDGVLFMVLLVVLLFSSYATGVEGVAVSGVGGGGVVALMGNGGDGGCGGFAVRNISVDEIDNNGACRGDSISDVSDSSRYSSRVNGGVGGADVRSVVLDTNGGGGSSNCGVGSGSDSNNSINRVGLSDDEIGIFYLVVTVIVTILLFNHKSVVITGYII